jgi:hypothetical protein
MVRSELNLLNSLLLYPNIIPFDRAAFPGAGSWVIVFITKYIRYESLGNSYLPFPPSGCNEHKTKLESKPKLLFYDNLSIVVHNE